MNPHLTLFNRIAFFYSAFFKGQVRGYRYAIQRVKHQFDLKATTVLDLGTGTGALARAFYESGYSVTGIDGAPKMVREAKKMNKDTDMKFELGNILEGINYPDSSFDIVIASFVAHGLKKEQRLLLYKEGYRLAKKYFILHDYSGKKIGPFMQFIEWIEQGDYFNFYKNAESEIKTLFQNLKIIDIEKNSCWYIVEK